MQEAKDAKTNAEAEQEEKLKRQANLMIFNLQEREETDRETRQIEEVKAVTSILDELEVTSKPQETRRIGTWKGTSTEAKPIKPRPLRITFTSKEDRDTVLKAFIAKKKVLLDDPSKMDETISKLGQLVIKKDLTLTERKLDKDLYLELKQKREASKNCGDCAAKWVRRNGKIINVGHHRERKNLSETNPDRPPQ